MKATTASGDVLHLHVCVCICTCVLYVHTYTRSSDFFKKLQDTVGKKSLRNTEYTDNRIWKPGDLGSDPGWLQST